MRNAVNSGSEVRQTTLFCFSDPFVRIAVAVEDDTLVFLDNGNQQRFQLVIELVSRNAFHLVGDVREFAGNNGIQQRVRAADVVGRTNHTEFETVAGESERRSPVPVGGILREVRQSIYADLEYLGFALVGSACFQCVQNAL